MKAPKISVIIPVYNTAKFLPHCLDSLLLQKYQNLEIIAVNDASKDNSLEILQKYAKKDHRIKIISQPYNQGQASARNLGLKNATGEYVSFVDSDDWVSLCLYEKFITDIKKIRKPVDIYMFNGFCFFEDTKFQQGIFPLFDVRSWHGYLKKKIFSFRDNKNPFIGTISVCNKIFSKKYLDTFGFLFLENKIFEDVLFSMQTFLSTDNIYVKNDYLYNYRQHNNSTVHTMGQNAFDLFFIHDEVEKLFKQQDFYEKSKYALFQFRFIDYYNYLFKLTPNLQEKFLNQAKETLIKKASILDEQIYRNLSDIEKFDELTTKNMTYLNLKYNKY